MALHVAHRTVSLDPRATWRLVQLEVASESRSLRSWFAMLTACLVAGALGAAFTIAPGTEVFGTTPAFEWGVLISAYVFFVVTTSGLCLVSALGQVFGVEAFRPVARRAAVLAAIFLVTGFVVIALDLHYPVRLLFGAVFSPSPSSAMWWMGTLYAIYLVFLVIELAGMFLGSESLAKAGSALTLATAILAPSTLGAVFGTLVSRSFWHGGLAPVYLILTALVSGAALLGIVFSLVERLGLRGGSASEAVVPALGKLLALMLSLTAFLTAWQTIVGLYGGVPGEFEATMALVFGPLSVPFWVFTVGIGMVAPLAILLRPRVAGDRAKVVSDVLLASCLAFGGMFVERIAFVAAGQITPMSAASGIVVGDFAAYVPSAVEVGIVVGALGLAGLLYTIAERFVDLGEPLGAPLAAVEIPPLPVAVEALP
jgi:molybdopterin-containing oxidoreductase family membrane subunit